MSLTRRELLAMDISSENVQKIIDGHLDSLNAKDDKIEKLEREVAQLRSSDEKLEKVTKERDEALDKLKTYEKDGWPDKYSKLKDEFDQYKNDIEAEKVRATKIEQFKAILKDVGVVNEESVSKVIRYTEPQMDSWELDKEGKLKGIDEIAKYVKTEWPEHISDVKAKGKDPSNPPSNNGGDTFDKLSLSEKMAYANEHPESAEVKHWLSNE